MLEDILKAISPDLLVKAIKSNPIVVQIALQKFEAYKSFAEDLSNSQQIIISNNLDHLDAYFKSDVGRDAVAILAEEFVKFVKSPH